MSKKRKIIAIGVILITIIAIFGAFIATSGANVYEVKVVDNGSTYSAANEYFLIKRSILEDECSFDEIVFNVELQNVKSKTPSDVAVVLDTTGSMSGNRLQDIKEPAKQAVEILYNNLGDNGLRTSFVTYSQTQIALGSNLSNLTTAIQNSNYTEGNTETALTNAVNSLASSTNNKSILLFTDGTDYPQEKITQIRESGINVYVIIVDGNLNQVTDTQDVYHYTEEINSIITSIIARIDASDDINDINIKEVIPSDILNIFDLTVSEVPEGQTIEQNAVTGFTWNIDSLMAQDIVSLKYKLKLKEGITIDSSMLNQEIDTNTSLEVSSQGFPSATLSNSPIIKIENVNTQEATSKLTIKAISDNDNNIAGVVYDVKIRYENNRVLYNESRTTNQNGEIVIDNIDIQADQKMIVELRPISVPTGYILSDTKHFVINVDIANNNASVNEEETTESLINTDASVDGDGNLVATVTDVVKTKQFELKIKTINKELESQILTNGEYKLTDKNGKEYTSTETTDTDGYITSVKADVLGVGKYTYTLTQTQAPTLFNIAQQIELEIGFDSDGVVTSIEIVDEIDYAEVPNSAIPKIVVKNLAQQTETFSISALIVDGETNEIIVGENYKAILKPYNFEFTNLVSDESGKIPINNISATGQVEIEFVHTPTEDSKYRKQENKSIIVNIDPETGLLSVPAGQEIWNGTNKAEKIINVRLTHQQKLPKNRLEIIVQDEIDYATIQDLQIDFRALASDEVSIPTTVTEEGIIVIDDLVPEYGEGAYYYQLNIVNPPDAYNTIDTIKLKLVYDEEGILQEVTQITRIPNVTNITDVIIQSDDEYAIHRSQITIELERKYETYNFKLILQDENHTETKIDNATYFIKVISGGIKAREYITDENGEIFVDVLGKDKIEIIIEQRSAKYGYSRNLTVKKLVLNIADGVITYGEESQDISQEEVTIEGKLVTFVDTNTLIVEGEEKARVRFNLGVQNEELSDINNIKFEIRLDGTEEVREYTTGSTTYPEFPIKSEGVHTFYIKQLTVATGYDLPTQEIKVEIEYKLYGNEMRADRTDIIIGSDRVLLDEDYQEVTDVFMLYWNLIIKNEKSANANSSIDIEKVDATTGEELSNARYDITLISPNDSANTSADESTDESTEGSTDESEETVNNVIEQVYSSVLVGAGSDVQQIVIEEGMTIIIQEVEPPIGYILDPNPITINIQKEPISGELFIPPLEREGVTVDLLDEGEGKLLYVRHENGIRVPEQTEVPFTFKLLNVSELNEDLGLQGTKYNIEVVQTYNEQNSIGPMQYTVNDNGEITINDIRFAEEIIIKFNQTTPSTGYKLNSEQKVLVINRDPETLEMTVKEQNAAGTETTTAGLNYNIDQTAQEITVTDVSTLNFLMNISKMYNGTALSGAKYEVISNLEDIYGYVSNSEYEKTTSQEDSNKISNLAFSEDYVGKTVIFTIKEIDVPIGYKGNDDIKLRVLFDENGLIEDIEQEAGLEYIQEIGQDEGTKILNIKVNTEILDRAPVITINKKDSVSEENLQGAQFKVKVNLQNADGTRDPKTLDTVDSQATNEQGNVSINMNEGYALKTIVYTISENVIPKYYKQFDGITESMQLIVTYDRQGFVKDAKISEDYANIATVKGHGENTVGIEIKDELDAKVRINITNIDREGNAIPGTIFRGTTVDETRLTKATDVTGVTQINFGAEYKDTTIAYVIKSENIAPDDEMILNVVYDQYGNIENAYFDPTEHVTAQPTWSDGEIKQINVTIIYNVFRIKLNFLNEDGTELWDYENSKFDIAINDGSSVETKTIEPSSEGKIDVVLGEIVENSTITYTISQTQVPYGFVKTQNISTTVVFNSDGEIQSCTQPSNIETIKTRTTVTFNIKTKRLDPITFNIEVVNEKHVTPLSDVTLDIKTVEIPHSTIVEQVQATTDEAGKITTQELGTGIVDNSIKYSINQVNDIEGYNSLRDIEFILDFNGDGKVRSARSNIEITVDTETNTVNIKLKIASKIIIGIDFTDWNDTQEKLYGSEAKISVLGSGNEETVSYESGDMQIAYIGEYARGTDIMYKIEQTQAAEYYNILGVTAITVSFDINMNVTHVSPDDNVDGMLDVVVPVQGDELYGVVDFKMTIKNRPTAKYTINITNILRDEEIPVPDIEYTATAFYADGTLIEQAEVSGSGLTNDQGKVKLMFNSDEYPSQSVMFKIERLTVTEYTDDKEVYLAVAFDENGERTGKVILTDADGNEIASDTIFKIEKDYRDSVYITIRSKGKTTFTINLTKYYKRSTYSEGGPYHWHVPGCVAAYVYQTTWNDVYVPYISFKAKVEDKDTGEVLDEAVQSAPVNNNGTTQLKFNKKYNNKTVIFTISEIEIANYKAAKDIQVEVRFDGNGNVLGNPVITNLGEFDYVQPSSYDGAKSIAEYGAETRGYYTGDYGAWWLPMWEQINKVYKGIDARGFGEGKIPIAFVSETGLGTKEISLALYRSEDNNNITSITIQSKDSITDELLDGTVFKVRALTATNEINEEQITDPSSAGESSINFVNTHANRTITYEFKHEVAADDHEKVNTFKILVTYDANGDIIKAEPYSEYDFIEISLVTPSNFVVTVKQMVDYNFHINIDDVRDTVTRDFLLGSVYRVTVANEEEGVIASAVSVDDWDETTGGTEISFDRDFSGQTLTFTIMQIQAPVGYERCADKVLKIRFDDVGRIAEIVSGEEYLNAHPVNRRYINLSIENEIDSAFDIYVKNVDKDDESIVAPGAKFDAVMRNQTNTTTIETRPAHTIKQDGTARIGFRELENFKGKTVIITLSQKFTATNYQELGEIKLEITYDSYGGVEKARVISGNARIEGNPKGTEYINLVILNEKIAQKQALNITNIEAISELGIKDTKFKVIVEETLEGLNYYNEPENITTKLEEKISEITNEEGKVLLQLDNAYSSRTIDYILTQESIDDKYIEMEEVKIRVIYNEEGLVEDADVVDPEEEQLGESTEESEEEPEEELTDEMVTATEGLSETLVTVKNYVDPKFTINITNVDKSQQSIIGSEFRVSSEIQLEEGLSQEEIRASLPTDVDGKTKVDFGTLYAGDYTKVIYTFTGNTISTQHTIRLEVTFSPFGKVAGAGVQILDGQEEGLIEVDPNYEGQDHINVIITSNLFNVDIGLVKDENYDYGESLSDVQFQITSDYDNLDITTEGTQETEDGSGIFESSTDLGPKPEKQTVTYNFKQVSAPYGYRAIPDFSIKLDFNEYGSIVGYNQDELPENIELTIGRGIKLQITNTPLERYMLNITAIDTISKNPIQGFKYTVDSEVANLGLTNARPELGKGPATNEQGQTSVFIGYAKEDTYINPTLLLDVVEDVGLEKYFQVNPFSIIVDYDDLGNIESCISTGKSIESLEVNETDKKQIDLVLKYEPKVTIRVETYEEGDTEKPVQQATYTIATTEHSDGPKETTIDGITTFYVGTYPESGEVEYKITQQETSGYKPIQDYIMKLEFTNFKVTGHNYVSGDTRIEAIIPDETSELYGQVDVVLKILNTPVFSIHLQGLNENGERLSGGKYNLYRGENTDPNNLIAVEFELTEDYKTIINFTDPALAVLNPGAEYSFTLEEVQSPLGYKVLSQKKVILKIKADENGKLNKNASTTWLLADIPEIEIGVGNINVDLTINYEQIKEFTIFIETVENGTLLPVPGVKYEVPGSRDLIYTTGDDGIATVEFNQIYRNANNQTFTIENEAAPEQFQTMRGSATLKMSTDNEGKIDENSVNLSWWHSADILSAEVHGNYAIKITVQIQRKLIIEFASEDKYTGESLGGTIVYVSYKDNNHNVSYNADINSDFVTTTANDVEKVTSNTTTAGLTKQFKLLMRQCPGGYRKAAGYNSYEKGNYIAYSDYEVEFSFQVRFDENAYVDENGLLLGNNVAYYCRIEKTGDHSIKITTLHEKLFHLTINSIDSADNNPQYNKFTITSSVSGRFEYWYANSGTVAGYAGRVVGGTAAETEVAYTIYRDYYISDAGFKNETIVVYVKYDEQGKIENVRTENSGVEIVDGCIGTTNLELTITNFRNFKISIQTKDYFGGNYLNPGPTYTIESDTGATGTVTSHTQGEYRYNYTTVGHIISDSQVTYTINKNTQRGYEDLKDIKLNLTFKENGLVDIAQSTYEFAGVTYGLSTNTDQMIYVLTSPSILERDETVNLVLMVRNKPGLIVDIETKDKVYSNLKVENAQYTINAVQGETQWGPYETVSDSDGFATVMAGAIVQNGDINYTITQTNVPGYVKNNYVIVKVTYVEGEIQSYSIVSGENENITLVPEYHIEQGGPAIKLVFENVPLLKIGLDINDKQTGDKISNIKYNIKVESSEITNTEYTSNENGVIIHENTAFNPNTKITYTISDVSTESSYRKISDIKFEVIFSHEGKIMHINEIAMPNDVILVNQLNSMVSILDTTEKNVHIRLEIRYTNDTYIVIKNQDSTLENVGIEGATFSGYIETPTVDFQQPSVTTDEKGIARLAAISDEGEATITFTQLSAADGYKMNETNSGTIVIRKTLNPFGVELVEKTPSDLDVLIDAEGEQVTIIVKNDRQLTLNIENINTELDPAPVGNVEFSVIAREGELTQTKDQILSTSPVATKRGTTNEYGEVSLDLGITPISKKAVYTITPQTTPAGYSTIEPINIVVEYDEFGKIKDNSKISKDSYRAKVGLEKELTIRTIIINGQVAKGYHVIVKHQDVNTNTGINGTGFEITIGDETSIDYTSSKMLNNAIKIEDGIIDQFTDLEDSVTVTIKQITKQNEYSDNLAEGTLIFTNTYNFNSVTNELDPHFQLLNVSGSFTQEDVSMDADNREIIITIKTYPKFTINIHKQNNAEKPLPVKEITFDLVSQVVGEDNTTNHGQVTTDDEGNASITIDNKYASKYVLYEFVETPKEGYLQSDDICLKVKYDDFGKIESVEYSNLTVQDGYQGTMGADVIITNEYDSTYKFFQVIVDVKNKYVPDIPLLGKTLQVVIDSEYGESIQTTAMVDENGRLTMPQIIANGNINVIVRDINLETEDITYTFEVLKDDANNVLEADLVSGPEENIEKTPNQTTGILYIKLLSEENADIINLSVETLDMYNGMNVSGVVYRVTDVNTQETYDSISLSSGLAYLRLDKKFNETHQYQLREITPGTGYKANTQAISFEVDYDIDGNIIEIRAPGQENTGLLQEQDDVYIKFRMYSEPISPNIGPFELDIQCVEAKSTDTPVPNIRLNVGICEMPYEGCVLNEHGHQMENNEENNITNDDGKLQSMIISKAGKIRIDIWYPDDEAAPEGRRYDNEPKYIEFERNPNTGEFELLQSENLDYAFIGNKVSLKIRNKQDDSLYTIIINNVYYHNGTPVSIPVSGARFDVQLPGAEQTLAYYTSNNGKILIPNLRMPETLTTPYDLIINSGNPFLGFETMSEKKVTVRFGERYGEKQVTNVTPLGQNFSVNRSSHIIEITIEHASTGGLFEGRLTGSISRYEIPTDNEYGMKFKLYTSGQVSWEESYEENGMTPQEVLEARQEHYGNPIVEYDVSVSQADQTFELSTIAGTYDILIDKPGFLDYIIKNVVITQDGETNLENIEIIPGDVSKNGSVGAEDIVLIKEHMDEEKDVHPGYSEEYDFNEDGVVSLDELVSYKTNVDKEKIIIVLGGE